MISVLSEASLRFPICLVVITIRMQQCLRWFPATGSVFRGFLFSAFHLQGGYGYRCARNRKSGNAYRR